MAELETYNIVGEVWKDIQGYEGQYMVSSKGRVKSVSRFTCDSNGYLKHKKERILKCSITKGYFFVSLNNGDIKRKSVHRLMCIAFLPNLSNKPQVNHKNGIKTDNRLENLEWCTNKENSDHAYRNGLLKKGEEINTCKLNQTDVKFIREMYKSGKYSQRRLARMFNISQSAIGRAIRKKSWRHVP